MKYLIFLLIVTLPHLTFSQKKLDSTKYNVIYMERGIYKFYAPVVLLNKKMSERGKFGGWNFIDINGDHASFYFSPKWRYSTRDSAFIKLKEYIKIREKELKDSPNTAWNTENPIP